MTEELAKYLGPFASVLMDGLTINEEKMSTVSQQRIIDTVTKEIEGEEEKSKFLMGLKRAGLVR